MRPDHAGVPARATVHRAAGRIRTAALGVGMAVGLTGAAVMAGGAPAQTPEAGPDARVSAAKAAAGLEWPGTFLRLCVAPPSADAAGTGRTGAARGAGRGAAGRGRGAVPPRESWYARPAKVADNLYFLGTRIHSAWALVGRDGIIVIEALYDYAAEDEIMGGLKRLGLDPARVKYVVLSHAHGDHDGGARRLQDEIPGGHLVYGAGDWAAVDARTGDKPRHDVVGTDGMTLSVGDAELRIVTTPGHTPGTLSYLFEIRDNGRPLRVAYVGGTAIPFNGTAEYYDTYLASSKKMADAAAAFGATVLLSNHTEFDNAFYKAHTAASREPGDPNPFEVGTDAVGRYFTVVRDCVTAAKQRAAAR